MSADVEVTHALLELGAATLGESGARADARPDPRGVARRPARGTGVSCSVHVGRQPGDPRRGGATRPRVDALVVDVGNFRELGYWGEVLTTAAQSRGLSGLVIDGGVRDITEIHCHGFPVFASMIALRGATKSRTGVIRAPIQCGGVTVELGDWIVGDADGVVLVPEATLADVINAGRVRAAQEAAMFRSLWEGRSTLELLDLDPSPIQEGDVT